MYKLYYKYGSMNSSKTANLLMTAHNLRSKNKSVLIIKPCIDDRVGIEYIKSRAINELIKADLIIRPEMYLIPLKKKVDLVLVDEAQFLSETNVNGLRNITKHVPVICYGLRTDYTSKLFEGSKRLFELADQIEEIKSFCNRCDKKSLINSKFILENNEKITIYDGNKKIDIGSEDKYEPLCWYCWNKNKKYICDKNSNIDKEIMLCQI